ncbi:MAG: hypothetical protein OXI06_08790 [bacterium]|nr:hypothetical protein [bacterium]
MNETATYYHVVVDGTALGGGCDEKLIVPADSHVLTETDDLPGIVLYRDKKEVARFARVLSWWTVQA